MLHYRPKSIIRLILTGFVVVTVPLALALVTAAVYVDRLTKHSQRSVFDAVNATQASLMLLEHVTDMERNARQYQVLGDPGLLQVYGSQHGQFRDAVKELQLLDLSPRQRELLGRLVTREQTIYDRLRDPGRGADIKAAVSDFPELKALSRSVLAASSKLIGDSVGEIEALAGQAQRQLIWQTLALIPAVLLFSAIFIALIVRPLKQIEHSINRLGNGHFDEEIRIQGPDDLRELGKRLEWMRQRLLELESQKMMFLRHMSHELNTPLTTIREGAELLNDQVVGGLNTEQVEIAAMLKQNSVQLQRLIEDLLSFSSLQSTTQLVHQELVQLDRLIEDQVQIHRLTARSKYIQVQMQTDPVTLIGDPGKLRIIVDNLLSNAIKYSLPGGRVKISLTRSGGTVTIDVQDGGPGVAAEEREKIFEAFFQGQARARSHVRGSGLGLFIVREFTRLHRGTIEVIDEPVGAHFRVTLPGGVSQERQEQLVEQV